MDRFVLCASGLLAALVINTALAAPAVHEYTLGNGMKVLVKEDHRTPVVVAQVWYRVGSAYEPYGTTGISHALEHMMFKGTKKYPAGEFSRIIAENGGKENAFTSRDYTAYFQQLEASRLPVSMEMESDRMRNLVLNGDEFAKEIKVVMEERRLRTEDEPQSVAIEQFNATAFVNNPYRVPVIGWMSDLEQMTVKDLGDWYKTWYAPNNATLVVVGDVDPEAVHKLAAKYYGVHKPSKVPEPKSRPEIPQKGPKRINVKVPAELPMLVMGYGTPTAKTAAVDWEPYALEVLAGVLDGGDSARFAVDLIRTQQVAASADAGYTLFSRFDNLFTLDGTPSQGKTVEDLEKSFRDQIERIKKEAPSQEEMDRVKAQVVASKVYERDSIFYQAMQLGSLISMGLDWRLADQYLDRIQAVTAEQVQAVAKKYLVDDQLTVAILDPQPISNDRPHGMGGAGGHDVR